MRVIAWMTAAAATLGLCAVSVGQITGKVVLEGQPPEMPEIKAVASNPQCAAEHKDPVYEETVLTDDHNDLANVVVFIKEEKEGDLKGPKIDKPAVIDQKGCVYVPHVLAVEVGQPILVKNSDPFLHNVHSLAIDNPTFNFAEVNQGEKKIDPFTAVETFQIKCDVHPWMKQWVRVFDHPYFAVTGEDGKFTIDTNGLKDGQYEVQAWQELYHDSAPQTITVKNGKADKELEFKYKSNPAKAQALPVKQVHLAACSGCNGPLQRPDRGTAILAVIDAAPLRVGARVGKAR